MKTFRLLLCFILSILLPFSPVTVSAVSSHGQVSTSAAFLLPRGGGYLPAGYNPFGYRITTLGEEFLKFEGSRDSDVGKLLSSLKSSRKRLATLKEQWLEITRQSKAGQDMRIYRMLQELLNFCANAGLVD